MEKVTAIKSSSAIFHSAPAGDFQQVYQLTMAPLRFVQFDLGSQQQAVAESQAFGAFNPPPPVIGNASSARSWAHELDNRGNVSRWIDDARLAGRNLRVQYRIWKFLDGHFAILWYGLGSTISVELVTEAEVFFKSFNC